MNLRGPVDGAIDPRQLDAPEPRPGYLTRTAESVLSDAGQEVDPATIAFKAMALFQRGRSDQAREELHRLNQMISQDSQSGDGTAHAFCQEAEKTIADP